MSNTASIFILLFAASASGEGIRWLFPETKQYTFDLKTNVSTGSLQPVEAGSYTTLHARLTVQVFNDTRIRLNLDQTKSSLYKTDAVEGNSDSTHALPSEAEVLGKPWEAHYHQDSGMILAVAVSGDDLAWSANIKRAIAISLQLVRVNATDALYKKSYTVIEPCLHDTCAAEYSGVDGTTVRKLHAVPTCTRGFGRSIWFSVRPDVCNKNVKQPFIGSAERIYELDERGLLSLDLKSSLEYHIHNHLLAVVTSMTLYRDRVSNLEPDVPAVLNSTYPAYHTHTYKEPTNQRASLTQEKLSEITREILTRISENIDNDKVQPDSDKVHNLDLVLLHKTMSQLNLTSLKLLNNELHVGTSYLNETNRNVFLEALPHVKSADSAKLVKYLVMDFHDPKFEETTALSLIRKLPFNVDQYSQELLLHMEDMLNLPPGVSRDVRHASILSFATLAFHTYINLACTKDEFEGYVQKYFRMYTECPTYADRLVWLQGLANLQVGSVSSFLGPLIQDRNVSRHERMQAIWATMPLAEYTPELTTSLYWPILTDSTEHIQLRVSALLMLLHGQQTPSRILSIHRYVASSDDGQLKQFWYTTIKSLEGSSNSCFGTLSKLSSYVSDEVKSPGSEFWATGNYIMDTSDPKKDYSAMGQFMLIGKPSAGTPEFLYFTLNSNQAGLTTNQISVMIKAEGLPLNVYNKFLPGSGLDVIADLLRDIGVKLRTPQPVHIEVTVSVQGKTLYAAHINQTADDWMANSPMLMTLKELITSESHVNQQLVQFPLQTEVNIPTELGTPVTLKTTWSSFFSLRGTMTSPQSDEWFWIRKNHIHFRYHGTAVTSLSSYGPVLDSEHSVYIQQSTVAHLPLKFDLKARWKQSDLSFSLTWLNEDPTGGMALHARTQVSLAVGREGALKQYCSRCQEIYTVRAKDSRTTQKNLGVFFDCDRPMTAVELLEKVFDTNRANFDILTSLHPSLLLVQTLHHLSIPPQGACGLVVPSRFPYHLKSGTHLEIEANLSNINDIVDNSHVTVQFSVALRESRSFGETLYFSNGSFVFQEDDSEKIHWLLKIHGYEPRGGEKTTKNWQMCLEQEDSPRSSEEQDLSIYPQPYQGVLKYSYDSQVEALGEDCSSNGTLIQVRYTGEPVINYNTKTVTKYFDSTLTGHNLNTNSIISDYLMSSFEHFGKIFKIKNEPLEIKVAIVVNDDGIADVTVDRVPKFVLRGEDLDFIDSWTNVQVLSQMGIYRTCRLEERTVETFSGSLTMVQNPACKVTLVLAECTERPRFAILKQDDGSFKLVGPGGSEIVLLSQLGEVNVWQPSGEEVQLPYRNKDFKITKGGSTVMVTMEPGVLFYLKSSQAVIKLADTFVDVVCGACVPTTPYSICK